MIPSRLAAPKGGWFVLGVVLFAAGLGSCGRPGPVQTSAPPAPGVGLYKLGQPYRAGGDWYRPAEDYRYDRIGIASWYGRKFHGRPTANGEIFDMHKVSAAHRTLPLPSLVEVTNLANGRRLTVRVNDRGPFAHGRIIDLSRRGAELLGFRHRGTAKVRVRVLAEESRILAELARGEGAPAGSSGSAPEVDGRPPATLVSGPGSPRTTHDGADAGRLFVQAGAFTDRQNATRLGARLSDLAPTNIVSATIDGRRYYRLRLGPAPSASQADALLRRVVDAGVAGARIVVD